jgi:hypothetical protein
MPITAPPAPAGERTVFRSPDGRWEAMAHLGPDPATGRRRRVHLGGPTKASVTARLRRLREQGGLGDRQSVAEWLGAWPGVIAG